MLKHLISFYKVSQPKPCSGEPLSMQQRSLKRLQWSTFLSATLGYGMYYVCRLSLNVVKKPIVEEGIFSETELGIIGAVLFFTYAVGKFTNGFLADRSNINRFMSTGLLVTALVNLFLGFVHSFILFAILWGNGTIRKLMAQYKKYALLIIDEWLLYPLKETEARDLLEIVESRYKRNSTIFCSQFDIPGWPEKLSDPLLADAICDRIVHDAYTVVIGGKESMRKRKGLQDI